MEKHVCHIGDAHHSEKIKKNLTNRLNRIEGQIRGITKMIDDDIYCDDVLNQIASVEAALKGVKKSLLEAHLKSCVIEQIENKEYEIIDELITTIGRMIK
jgi:DNA-binding FrmR family transcriptional regulator